MTTDDTRTRRQPASQRPPQPVGSGGLDVPTLAIAAIASVVAATVVSHFWGSGTIIATALTPVIVAVVKEGLGRPARRLTEVSAKAPTAAAKIMGARHEADGPVVIAEEYDPHDEAVGEYRVYGRPTRERNRRAWRLAIVTGLLAFVIAAAAMTLPELVAGRSLFSSGKETTLFRGNRHTSRTKTTTTSAPSATQTTVTTVTQTTTVPTQTTPTVTQTVPAQTQTTPSQTTTAPPPAATTTPQTTPAP